LEQPGKVLVTGGVPSSGEHLVANLLRAGHSNIRVVDCKSLSDWYRISPKVENIRADLRELRARRAATRDVRYVFNLAADRGKVGFIETDEPDCTMLMAAREASVKRVMYSSSACVYAAENQTSADVVRPLFLRGSRAPDENRLVPQCLGSSQYLRQWARNGAGRDLSRGDPRKTIGFQRNRDLGRGQTGSQLHVRRRLYSGYFEGDEPLNLGGDRPATINQLAEIVETIGEVKLKRVYNLSATTGVRGRNSDNTLIVERLGWGGCDFPRVWAGADLSVDLQSDDSGAQRR
jgi:GDP-D-mannose 3',5'-epimerase